MMHRRSRLLRFSAMVVVAMAMSNQPLLAGGVVEAHGGIVSAVDGYRIVVNETDFYIGTTTDIPENFLANPESLQGRNVSLQFVEFNQVRKIHTLTVVGG